MELKEVALDTLAGGALPERFSREFQAVLENIQDPNTEAGEVRSITLTVKLKPNEDRDRARTAVSVKTKLAGPKPVETTVHMGRNKSGRLVAVDYDPRQAELFCEGDPDVTPLPDRAREEG